MAKQIVENVQNFMFTMDAREHLTVNLSQVLEAIYELIPTGPGSGKKMVPSVGFKVNSIELVGARGAQPVRAQDAIGRDIIAKGLDNVVKIPLFPFSCSYYTGSDILPYNINPKEWNLLGGAPLVDFINSKTNQQQICKNLPNGVGSQPSEYARWEIRVSYFVLPVSKA